MAKISYGTPLKTPCSPSTKAAMRLGILAFLALFAPGRAGRGADLDHARGRAGPDHRREINGRPVRLEVDPRMPDMLALVTAAAERLGVRRLPFAQVAGRHRRRRQHARAHRPSAHLLWRTRRAQFRRRVSRAGQHPRRRRHRPGLAALRHRHHHARRRRRRAARDIVLPLEDADIWSTQAQVGGQSAASRSSTSANRGERVQSPGGAHVRSRRRDPGGGRTGGASGHPRPVHPDAAGAHRAHRSKASRSARHSRAPSRRCSARWRRMRSSREGESSETPPTVDARPHGLTQAGCSSISVNRRTQAAHACAAPPGRGPAIRHERTVITGALHASLRPRARPIARHHARNRRLALRRRLVPGASSGKRMCCAPRASSRACRAGSRGRARAG